MALFASCSEDKVVDMAHGAQIGFQSDNAPQFTRSLQNEEESGSFVIADPTDTTYNLPCEATVSVMQKAATRATTINTAADVTDIGVMAYADWYEPLLMNNDCYERNASDIFVATAGVKYWPGEADKKIDFYTYTPYNATGLSLPSDKTAPRTINYTVPLDADKQQDIMLAVNESVPGNYNQAVPLAFSHLLSSVKVVVGSLPSGAKLQSIAFDDVAQSGTLDMPTLVWTLDSDRAEFTNSNFTTNSEGKTESLMLLLPGSASTATQLKVTITENGNPRTLTALLPENARDWKRGMVTTYRINVADYKFTFDNEDKVVDAHYVIYKTILKADNIPSHLGWTLTASIEGDGSQNVTMQYARDVNAYAKQGFWLDKEIVDGKKTGTSARGTSIIYGTGSLQDSVFIFIPENVGTVDRNIKIIAEINGSRKEVASIVQKCPAWNGGIGWERIDDNDSGQYGFNWNRKVALIYPYTYARYTSKANNIKNYLDELITDNNAGSYAESIEYGSFANYRRYILIDYSKLSAVSGAASPDDGYTNTLYLRNYAGTAVTGTFEQALLNTKKQEEGKEHEAAFRFPDNGDPSSVPRPSGDENLQSGILNFVLKKNRYYLKKDNGKDADGKPIITVLPWLEAETDLVWFLPAYNQFGSMPAEFNREAYWSSTAANDGSNSYLGNGALSGRTAVYKVIVVRKQ